MTVVFMILLSMALALALVWLLFGRQAAKTDLTAAALDIKKLLPVHCRHFPQIQHILKNQDEKFICRRAPRQVTNRWRADRRRILRLYIRGLRQDFRGLEQLARLLAALSPEIKRKQESEWFWLGVQFRLLFRLTQLRFALHGSPGGELVWLAEMLIGLAATLERSIDRMTEALPLVQTSSSA
jgi:hypothetical protein